MKSKILMQKLLFLNKNSTKNFYYVSLKQTSQSVKKSLYNYYIKKAVLAPSPIHHAKKLHKS